MILNILLKVLANYGHVIAVLLPLIHNVFLFARKMYKRTRVHASFKGSSLLLSHLIQGDIINGHQGNTPAGVPYTYLIGGLNLFSGSHATGVYVVYLPFETAAHLIGLPRAKQTLKVQLFRSSMEEVMLEGDYPNYFQLLAEKGQQTDSRYMLDPKAMAFTIDFCKEVYWEIVGDALYFYSEDVLPSFKVVDQFIEEIRPALERPTPKNHARIPYGHMTFTTFLCPICSTKLVEGESWMQCPEGHGLLITGKQMHERRMKVSLKYNPPAYNDDRSQSLKCPYCAEPMIETRFQTTDVHIDRCRKCMYRWVDSLEAPGILGL